MDGQKYYWCIVQQAAHDTMMALGWKVSKALPLVIAFIAWLGTVFFFAQFEKDTAVMSQVSWYFSRALFLLPLVVVLFLCYLILAPYKLASTRERTHTEAIAKLQRQIAELSSTLDDRIGQQQKAREYSRFLHKGQKHLVKWIHEIRNKDNDRIQLYRDRSFKWLDDVKARLAVDFGVDVAERFNFGKPEQLIIGVSEPEEHQARLSELIAMIKEMRANELNLNVVIPIAEKETPEQPTDEE